MTFWIIVVSYILGSIPFGYLIVRARVGADIRKSGSGGTGATNVSRRAGKIAGILTLLLDAAKGFTAVLIAYLWVGQDAGGWPVGLAGLSVIAGHIFPIWLGFRGGKGVATGIGVFLLLAPIAVAMASVIFLTTIWLTRYVSLASMLTVAALPGIIWWQHRFGSATSDSTVLVLTATLAALLIVFAHRGNIARLLKGTESKFR